MTGNDRRLTGDYGDAQTRSPGAGVTVVHLVSCDSSHTWLLHRWRNEPSVAANMFHPDTVPAHVHARWYERLLREDNRFGWVISHADELVGATFLTNVDPQHSRADFGIYLAPGPSRGRGIAAAAQFLVINQALVERGLNKLCAQVLSHNAAGLAMYDRFGFEPEGVFRQHHWRGSVPLDVHHFALFRSTWLDLRDDARRRLTEKGLLACEN